MERLFRDFVFFSALGLTALAMAGCASAREQAKAAGTPVASATGDADFERDRQSILAMAGNFRVRFDMRETVPFLADYIPLEPKTSGGHEVVRVIEDTGNVIRLQHILVVKTDEGKSALVKHWRQDWVYEPAEVLVYERSGQWRLEDVAPASRRGAWSQTVWQTDDSPRYGGIGTWEYTNGVARWTSNETLRPLARRDAVRDPPYNRYTGINRHALTPKGWVHEQDNAKIGTRDGKDVTFVHEVVVNSYDRFDGFDVAAAEDYWRKTKDYWAHVRQMWDGAIARNRGLRVAEVADTGSATGERLMELADDIVTKKISGPEAIAAAKRVIDGREAATAQLR